MPPVATKSPVASYRETPGHSRYQEIQDRLKQLGATYLLLEAWDEERRWYRFRCELPFGQARRIRRFEVTDVDPLLAMEQVLTRVEAVHKDGLE